MEVAISHHLDGLFSSLIVPNGVSVGASSVASWGGQSACILALDATETTGIRIDNVGKVVSPDCGIHTNSLGTAAISLDSGQIATTEIAMAGLFAQSNSGGNQVDGTLIEQAAEITDPFASIAEPMVSGCNKSGNYTSYTPALSLSPGVYCDGFRVQNIPKVVFAPGEYIIKNGNMEINNAVLEGSDVTFFLADGAVLIQNYSGTSELSAPTSGDLAGILFFQARDVSASTPTSYFRGGSVMNLKGAIYLPAGDLEFNNNAKVTISEAPGVAVVAQHLEFRGSAKLEVSGLLDGETASSGGRGRHLVQ